LGHVTGRDEGVEITLERLPEPEATRSLVGALRILLQKVASEQLGFEFDYPQLAAVSYDEQASEMVYDAVAESVKAKVAAASRIAVYVHGIIGESKDMAITAWKHPLMRAALPFQSEQYDLILAFDYESLQTQIEATAVDLMDKLTAVGLGPGHGKTLHVFAHSMGGLVSRWMVERVAGGNEMVQHLFLLGTPSGGSPWPKVQQWATVALSIGLNSLAPAAWPVTIVSGLLTLIEKIDVALDEMSPGSPFLKSLAQSPDPGVPYTIVAGNTSLIEAAKPGEKAPVASSGIGRLLSKVLGPTGLHDAASLAFFKRPNDVAVSVTSVHNVPEDRSAVQRKIVIPGDHFTYLTGQAGLSVVGETVSGLLSQT
jgi:pimeloyl-ACP methyl ester carboxylesterase